MTKKYKLIRPRFEHPAGTIVYDCYLCDYGCVNDDTRNTGIEHTKVTTDPKGGYPFFTVPEQDLSEITNG